MVKLGKLIPQISKYSLGNTLPLLDMNKTPCETIEEIELLLKELDGIKTKSKKYIELRNEILLAYGRYQDKCQKIKQKEIDIQQKIKNFKEIKNKDSLKDVDENTKSYLNLYGDEFWTYSPLQKHYLVENLSKIGKVMQFYLKYPKIAIKSNQQGMNILEFYIDENGDISDLKTITSSGYRLLDSNSLKTVKMAYKDFPKPFEKTKVKLYVYYQLR